MICNMTNGECVEWSASSMLVVLKCEEWMLVILQLVSTQLNSKYSHLKLKKEH